MGRRRWRTLSDVPRAPGADPSGPFDVTPPSYGCFHVEARFWRGPARLVRRLTGGADGGASMGSPADHGAGGQVASGTPPRRPGIDRLRRRRPGRVGPRIERRRRRRTEPSRAGLSRAGLISPRPCRLRRLGAVWIVVVVSAGWWGVGGVGAAGAVGCAGRYRAGHEPAGGLSGRGAGRARRAEPQRRRA